MRTGACSVQQALTSEAASVLKHSLSLARRRGHAQVTPLHVAATLLTSTSSCSSSNLLRRACLKSQPHHPASHPLQCRALELCFNVALNRLPTTPPPSSGSLLHTQPSLSNALIAALKRAQAHQRRGCIEQQQQQFHQQHNQQQQPLLAIKVELDQLIISILDDPSVSRVMREAGFSSTSVKNNLEEDSSVSGSPPSFLFDSHREIVNHASFWSTHFLKPPPEQNPLPHFSYKEDLRVVFEVMLRKQSRRNNIVVVGDSGSISEGLVSELIGRVERGEVPGELKFSHFIKLQLSYVHLRLMSRADVEMKVSDLGKNIASSAAEREGRSVIIYVGDLRWAVDEEAREEKSHGFRPVECLIGELGKLMAELRNVSSSRVWLMATASYQTYMRCQMRQPSLETQWALQAVVVPSGGLALSLQANPSGLDSKVPKLIQYPFQMLETKPFSSRENEDKILLCAECSSNFEREASDLKSATKDTKLPFWLRPQRPDNNDKESLLELRRKWNRLCQGLHHCRNNPIHAYSPFASSGPWYSSSLNYSKHKVFLETNSISFSEATPKLIGGNPISASQVKNVVVDGPKQWASEVRTTLALGNALFSDTATSTDQRRGVRVNARDLTRQLQENIPWQSETIPLIVEALLDFKPGEKKGTWLLVQGTDIIGKKRLARVAAESFYGSTNALTHIDTRSLGSRATETFTEALRKDPKRVFLIENIDQAHGSFMKSLAEGIKSGFLKEQFGREASLAHGIFILSTSTKLEETDDNLNNVLKMRFSVEESSSPGNKRKPEFVYSPNESKKSRTGEKELDLDLNISADDAIDEDEAVPSDLTHEIDDADLNLPSGLLESISRPFTLDSSSGEPSRSADSFSARLSKAFDEVRGGGEFSVDGSAAEGLVWASGLFLESQFERWVTEVFQSSLATVGIGGKVRLGLEGKEGNSKECGFMGSVLPDRIHVD